MDLPAAAEEEPVDLRTSTRGLERGLEQDIARIADRRRIRKGRKRSGRIGDRGQSPPIPDEDALRAIATDAMKGDLTEAVDAGIDVEGRKDRGRVNDTGDWSPVPNDDCLSVPSANSDARLDSGERPRPAGEDVSLETEYWGGSVKESDRAAVTGKESGMEVCRDGGEGGLPQPIDRYKAVLHPVLIWKANGEEI